jgi:RND family efflux transporter MFP subunit
LALLPWQQSATGTGRVIAFSPQDRPQEVHAPIEGRISKWLVSEGTRVKTGDVLVELADNDPEIIKRLRLERKALERRKEAADQALATAKVNLERQKLLFEQGLSSRRQYEQARVELSRFEADDAGAAAEIARIDVRLSRQLSQTVRAPMDGTILRITTPGMGQMVKNGQTLLSLIPASQSRAVELWIDGNDLPLMSEGREVRIQFEGWPALQFSGWPSAAVGTFGGRVQLIDAADNGKGQFRLLVTPKDGESWPDPHYLRQGVRVHAFILLNRVKLGFELWRRFNGFPVSVSVDEVERARQAQGDQDEK